MRIVVTAVVLASIFGVWLTSRLQKDAEPLPSAFLERLLMTRPENSAGPMNDTAEASGARDADMDARHQAAGLPELATQEMSRGGFRRGSVITETLIGYLVEGGLSEFDSERIVRAAMEGLEGCRDAFTESESDRLACDRNVIQEAGMYESFRRLSREVLARYADRPTQER